MVYTLLSLLTLVLAAILGFWASVILVRSSWFLGWLRGTTGLCLIATVLVLGIAAWDIFSYRQLSAESKIATISFTKRDDQYYDATLQYTDGSERIYELYGDQWQLDARIFKWPNYLHRWGIKSGYRLDRLSGRYLSLEDEHNKPRSIHSLASSTAGIDVWAWTKEAEHWLPLLDARYGSATYLPMVDGGQYQITLSNAGLVARPLNKAAEAAISQWQ